MKYYLKLIIEVDNTKTYIENRTVRNLVKSFFGSTTVSMITYNDVIHPYRIIMTAIPHRKIERVPVMEDPILFNCENNSNEIKTQYEEIVHNERYVIIEENDNFKMVDKVMLNDVYKSFVYSSVTTGYTYRINRKKIKEEIKRVAKELNVEDQLDDYIKSI